MKEGNPELFVLHGPYRDGTPGALTAPAEPGPGPPLLARGAERARNGPACAELPPCPARHQPMGVFFPTSLAMRVLVGSFPALSRRNPSLTKTTPPFPRRGPEQRCHGACPASLLALGSRREQGKHCSGVKAG